MQYINEWRLNRKVKEEAAVTRVALEETQRKLEKWEELSGKVSFRVVKQLLEEVEEKEKQVFELKKQVSLLERKQLESEFVASHLLDLEEENKRLKEEVKRLRESPSGSKEAKQENALIKLNKMGDLALVTSRRGELEKEVEKKVKGLKETLCKPTFADNQKLVTDEEGRVVEVSFKRMLGMMCELDGRSLTKHIRSVFLGYKKLGVQPVEMLFHLVDLYCGVQRGDTQEKGWKKVLGIIKFWIRNFVADFQDEEMEEELFNFFEDTISLNIRPTKGV